MPIQKQWRRLRRFLQHDVWHLPEQVSGGRRSFLLRLLRIVVLAARGFTTDSLHLRASALTYYTLLSIVPALAMAFGIAKGFGMEAVLQRALQEQLSGQQEILERAVDFARSLLANTRGGLVAGFGVALLIWSVIRLLGNIEASFNAIWGVQQGRNPVRKLTDYLAVMILAPLLFLISSSSAVFISGRVNEAMATMGVLEPVGGAVATGLELIPYVFIWLLLTLLYLTMPNTRVSWRAGLAAGIVAGTLYQLLQFGYFQVVVNVARYNAIYGSFAALPLFLLWLHLSWLVVLVGAEVSFAVDNAGDYAQERAASRASHHQRRLIAMAAAVACAGRFLRGERPATAAELAGDLAVPTRLVQGALTSLVAAGILVEVQGRRDSTSAFHPASEPASLTLGAVAEAYDRVSGAAETGALADRDLVPDVGLTELAVLWQSLIDRALASDDNLSLDELARTRPGLSVGDADPRVRPAGSPS